MSDNGLGKIWKKEVRGLFQQLTEGTDNNREKPQSEEPM
jgi:hypothetical protein